jgi:hypothetical protein
MAIELAGTVKNNPTTRHSNPARLNKRINAPKQNNCHLTPFVRTRLALSDSIGPMFLSTIKYEYIPNITRKIRPGIIKSKNPPKKTNP